MSLSLGIKPRLQENLAMAPTSGNSWTTSPFTGPARTSQRARAVGMKNNTLKFYVTLSIICTQDILAIAADNYGNGRQIYNTILWPSTVIDLLATTCKTS